MTATETLRDLLAVEAAATPGPWEFLPMENGLAATEVTAGGGFDGKPWVELPANDNFIIEARNHLRPLTQALLDLAEGHAFTEDECNWTSMDDTGRRYCQKCGYDYPCKPVRIITKHLGDDNEEEEEEPRILRTERHDGVWKRCNNPRFGVRDQN